MLCRSGIFFSACFLRRRVSESEHGCICIVMMKGWGLAMDRLYNRNIREYDVANMYSCISHQRRFGETSTYALFRWDFKTNYNKDVMCTCAWDAPKVYIIWACPRIEHKSPIYAIIWPCIHEVWCVKPLVLRVHHFIPIGWKIGKFDLGKLGGEIVGGSATDIWI